MPVLLIMLRTDRLTNSNLVIGPLIGIGIRNHISYLIVASEYLIAQIPPPSRRIIFDTRCRYKGVDHDAAIVLDVLSSHVCLGLQFSVWLCNRVKVVWRRSSY